MPTSTRDKILQEAIHIFNHQGASKVSTVSLAAELNMSVGNLYYHFKNKEHIIRTIYMEHIAKEMDNVFMTPNNRLSESGILQFFLNIAKYTYRYRFFYFEIYLILSNDPELNRFYSERSERIIKEICNMFSVWIKLEIMDIADPADLRYTAENCWILGQTWTTHGHFIHPEQKPSELISEEIMHLYQMLKPRFTASSIERFERMIELTDCFSVEKSKALMNTPFEDLFIERQ